MTTANSDPQDRLSTTAEAASRGDECTEESLHGSSGSEQNTESCTNELDIEAQPETQLKKTETSASQRPHSVFSSRKKFFIVLGATLGAMFSPFTTNIYFPLIDVIASALHVSVTKVNLSITTYMIVQGLAPSFVSAVADHYGRRLAYVIGLVVYFGANLGLALNNSYAGLLILRCLQSAGSSGMVTLSQGTVADVITSAERGKYISITSISGILAPSLAPIIGGLLGAHLGWHSVFWFLLILGSVYLVPMALFFPETNRRIVGNGSIQPPNWYKTLPDLLRDRKRSKVAVGDLDAKDVSATQPRKKFNPLASLTVIAEPSTAALLLSSGILYSAFYAISTSITVQFHNIYDLDTTLQGLLFLPQAIGSILAAIVNTRLIDMSFARQARRANIPVDKKRQLDILATPLHIERARLEIAIPMLAASGILTVVFGWLLEARVSIWGPLVVLVFTAFTTLAGFSATNVLIIDLHRDRAATASAAGNLVRCLMGAGSAAVVNTIIDAVGLGWCFTIWGLLCAGVAAPLLLVVCRWGPEWRAKRVRIRDEKKAMEKEKEKMQVAAV